MAILEIRIYPDPVLTYKCDPVSKIEPRHLELIRDMAQTMFEANGLGLAAPQVGVSEPIIVVNLATEEEPEKYMALINPRIDDVEGEAYLEEGCLSIPKYHAEVKRAKKVEVIYQDIHGATQELVAEDLLARVMQHEIDHLNGILFIDYLSRLRRSMVRKRMAKRQAAGNEA